MSNHAPRAGRVRRRIGFGCAATLLASTAAIAQEALRASIAGQEMADARRQSLENLPYNVQLGPVSLVAGLRLGLEWTDNPFGSAEPEPDFIIRPTFNLLGTWPVTEKNALTLSLGVGYQKYLNDSEQDQLVLTPDSAIEFDVYVRDFKINLHERFSYVHEPLSQGALSNAGNYGGFYNTAGAAVDWDLNDVILTLGFDRFDFRSSDPVYEYLDRGTGSAVLSAMLQAAATVRLGPQFSIARNEYLDPILNNSWNLNLGAVAEWTLTPRLSIDARGGYTIYQFDEGGLVGPTPDRDSYYAGLTIRSQLMEMLNLTLSATHGLSLGITADLNESTVINLSAGWVLFENWSLGTSLFVERGEEAGQTVTERYHRIGGSISIGRQLLEKLSVQVAYRITDKDSDFAGRDYLQNSVTLNLNYRF